HTVAIMPHFAGIHFWRTSVYECSRHRTAPDWPHILHNCPTRPAIKSRNGFVRCFGQIKSRESTTPMTITRRALLGALAATPVLTTFSVRASSAPISLYVPYGAGGPVDGISRFLADGLTKVMGRTFLVENRPGGNGIVAAQFVASSRQPETSLFVAGTGPFSLNILLRKNLPFNREQFKPVSLLADGPLAMTVSSKNPATDLKSFLENAKASGKPQRFGTFGPGSLSQLFGALLNQELGLEVAEVAYKTTAEEVRDIIGGQVDFSV